MSILEAMAIDVSTIATPAGGTPQLINDGVDGFLVTGDNNKVLASDWVIFSDRPSLEKTWIYQLAIKYAAHLISICCVVNELKFIAIWSA